MEQLQTWLKAERGRVSLLARACGVTHGAVLQWKDVPPARVRAIEEVTGISRHILRPDIFGPAQVAVNA